MRGMIVPALLLVLAAGVLSLRGTAADGPEQPVAELIEQLAAPKFADRERAARLLQARGPVALPELRKALKHPDAEVRRRARTLVAALEAAAALEPKRITLRADKQPLAAVLKDVEKQTGYKLSAEGMSDEKRFTFDLKGMPFWEAVERLRDEAGLAVRLEFLEEGIQLRPTAKRARFVRVNGPFRLELTRIDGDRAVDFTNPGEGNDPDRRDQRLSLSLSLLAEPRFILLHTEPPQIEVARDEDGKELRVAPPPAKGNTFDERLEAIVRKEVQEKMEVFRRDFQDTARIELLGPPPGAKRLKELRGTIPVLVVVGHRRVVVTENLPESQGKEFRSGDDTLKIAGIQNRDSGEIMMHIAVPPERGGIRPRWLQRFHVEDANGVRCRETISSPLQSGQEHYVVLGYKADDGKSGPPMKLVLDDWVVVQHRIPFEFREVPLP